MTPPPTSAAARVRAATAVPAPLRLPPAPRRVSGPARADRVERTATPPARGFSGALLRLIDHPWLERLIRGRAWIAIVATALLGIVAMQVALLRFGAQIGGETAAVNTMIQRNTTIQDQIAAIEASGGQGASAAAQGMFYPPPGAVTYLQQNPGDALRAVELMVPPSAAAAAAAAAHPPRAVITVAKAKVASASTAKTGASGAAGAASSATTAADTGATGGASTTAGAGASTAAGTTSAGTTTTGTSSPTTSSTATTATSGSGTPATSDTAGTAALPPATSGSAGPPTTSAGGSTATSAAGGAVAPAANSSGG